MDLDESLGTRSSMSLPDPYRLASAWLAAYSSAGEYTDPNPNVDRGQNVAQTDSIDRTRLL